MLTTETEVAGGIVVLLGMFLFMGVYEFWIPGRIPGWVALELSLRIYQTCGKLVYSRNFVEGMIWRSRDYHSQTCCREKQREEGLLLQASYPGL